MEKMEKSGKKGWKKGDADLIDSALTPVTLVACLVTLGLLLAVMSITP